MHYGRTVDMWNPIEPNLHIGVELEKYEDIDPLEDTAE